jgi:RNA polymerase sigma-70 factor (ECF subfamily)
MSVGVEGHIPSDDELIERANAGDETAMRWLYLRYRSWVISTARRFVGAEEDALDVAQEVFIYLFRKFPGFRLTCQMKTFLFPVIRNVSLKVLRKRARLRPLAEGIKHAASKGGAVAGEGTGLLEMVASLPERQREVVMLRFAEGLSLEEIARRLEVSVGTVKSRLHHALHKLRRVLCE